MTGENKNIEKIISLMQTDDSVDAPADAIKWSKNIFKSRIAAPKRGLIETIVAVLNQDLQPGQAVFGERSGSAGQTRQMLFVAGENSVDLRVTQKSGKFEIRGQILGDGCDEAAVNLGQAETKVDEFGSFVFSDISAGSYEMIIHGVDREIVLKSIEVE